MTLELMYVGQRQVTLDQNQGLIKRYLTLAYVRKLQRTGLLNHTCSSHLYPASNVNVQVSVAEKDILTTHHRASIHSPQLCREQNLTMQLLTYCILNTIYFIGQYPLMRDKLHPECPHLPHGQLQEVEPTDVCLQKGLDVLISSVQLLQHAMGGCYGYKKGIYSIYILLQEYKAWFTIDAGAYVYSIKLRTYRTKSYSKHSVIIIL